MKWSQFIKDDNKSNSSFDSSRLKSSKRIKTQMPQLALKSIQKLKIQLSASKIFQNGSPSSISTKQTKIKDIKRKISSQTDKRYSNQSENCPHLQTNRYPQQKCNFDNIIEQFERDFKKFVENFLEKIQPLFKSQDSIKQIGKSILSISQSILLQHFQMIIQTSLYFFQKAPQQIFRQNLVLTKKKLQKMNTINDKTEKKIDFSKIQKNIEKANNILGKQKKNPRFFRTSKVPAIKQANISAIDSIQPSIQSNKKIHRSRMKSKDTLYNMNKILNQ